MGREQDEGETNQERALDGIAAATADTPGAEEECAGDSDTDQRGIDVAKLGEASDPPEEVDGAGDDGTRGDE